MLGLVGTLLQGLILASGAKLEIYQTRLTGEDIIIYDFSLEVDFKELLRIKSRQGKEWKQVCWNDRQTKEEGKKFVPKNEAEESGKNWKEEKKLEEDAKENKLKERGENAATN